MRRAQWGSRVQEPSGVAVKMLPFKTCKIFIRKRRTGLNERFSNEVEKVGGGGRWIFSFLNEVEIVGQGRHWTKSILLPVRLAAC